MKEENIKVVVINDSTATFKTVPNDIDAFYKELNCDLFDIATRKIDNRVFDIYCDDEGLFVENARVSAIDKDENIMLVGNLMITNHDDEGNTTSLTEEEASYIIANVGYFSTLTHKTPYPVLMNVEYC